MTRRVLPTFLATCAAALLIGACGVDRSDERLAFEIEQQLSSSPVLQGAHIDVTANAGVVTLRGVVADEVQRVHATTLAWGIDGVETVENRLEVAEATPAPPPAVGAAPSPPEAGAR